MTTRLRNDRPSSHPRTALPLFLALLWFASALFFPIIDVEAATWFELASEQTIDPIGQIRLANLDSNETLDCVFTAWNYTTRHAFLCTGNGVGGLSVTVSIPMNSGVYVTSGDYTGDNRTDVCLSHNPVSAWYADYNYQYPGPGMPIRITAQGSSMNAGDSGDVDADGYSDLVGTPTGDREDIRVFWGSPEPLDLPSDTLSLDLVPSCECGAYCTQVGPIQIVDLDVDGLSDILVSAYFDSQFGGCSEDHAAFGWFRYLGNREYEQTCQWFYIDVDSGYLGRPGVGHFNNDPYPDLVFLEASSHIRVLLSVGPGVYQLTGFQPFGTGEPIAADFDADGMDDFVVNTGGRTVAYRGLGGGAFVPVDSLQILNRESVAGDLTGDGRPDLVVAVYISSTVYKLQVYRNVTSAPAAVPSPGEPRLGLVAVPNVTSGAPVRLRRQRQAGNRDSARSSEANLLRITDAAGRVIRVLELARATSTHAEGVWDLRDEDGRPVRSGVYWISSVESRLEEYGLRGHVTVVR